jgi:hypothetical protein
MPRYAPPISYAEGDRMPLPLVGTLQRDLSLPSDNVISFSIDPGEVVAAGQGGLTARSERA